jgi:hypothetical protein
VARIAALVVGCATCFALASARQAESGDYLRWSTPLDTAFRLGLLPEVAGATSTPAGDAAGVGVDRWT